MASSDGSCGSHLASFLFASAEQYPDKVCVEEGDAHFSYSELAELAVALRGGLREALGERPEQEPPPPAHGRRPSEEIVSVVLPRGALCIAAVHAVMLEGNAYNVFDLGNPREVLAAQLEIARPPVVISSAAVAEQLDIRPLLPEQTILLDAEELLHSSARQAVAEGPLRPLDSAALAAASDRLAYVIFTSGSTGKPKAVMIEHRSACNQVRVFGETYGLAHADRVCQSISMAFDPHVNEVFGAFAWGCTVVVMSDAVKQSGPDMLPWIEEECISVLTMTPSGYRMMMSSDADVDVSRQGLPHLRICGSGGEALSREVLDTWAVGRKFFNLYGPTETTITSVMAELRPGDSIVIGRSLPSYQNVVLDPATLAAVASGEHGVLFTGGPGVARGYLNEEAKTRERFIDVPGIGRTYNTGDVVFQDDAGDFHWIGRADFQAKVRGNRIELEYLEHAIMNVPGVTHCEARVTGNGQRLVLLASGAGVAEAALREAASKLGRAYELSTVKIVDAAAWSFSINGKLLRNTVPLEEDLPAEDNMSGDNSMVHRLTGRELEALGTAAIAIELARSLGVAVQGADDDFFSSGGTSVTAATLVSKLRQLGKRNECLVCLKSVAVRDIYECRTMGKLAELLDGTGPQSFTRRLWKSTITPTASQSAATASGTERFYLVFLMQVVWILTEMGLLFMGIVRLLFWAHTLKLPAGVKYAVAAALVVGLLPLVIIVQSLVILVFKKVTCFRPRNQQRIQLWSLHYFRWWAVHHMQELIPTMLIAGTPFASYWAWLMGAKVGRGVLLWTVPKNADLELLELGDGVNVGQETYFNTTVAEKGVLVLGPIKVGAGASLGCRVNVARGAVVAAGALVDDLKHVTRGFRAPAADIEAGLRTPRTMGGRTPMTMSGRTPRTMGGLSSDASSTSEQQDLPQEAAQTVSWYVALAMLPAMGVVLSLYSFVLPVFLASFVMIPVNKALFLLPPTAGLILWFILQCVTVQVLSFLLVIALKWLFVGRLGPGSFTVGSLKYLRFWFMQNLVGFGGSWLPLTCMTTFYPVLMRLLGSNIGLKAEIGSFTFGYCPDLLTIGRGAFLADRCSVGGVQMRGGVCELKRTVLGERSFVGNLAVVKAGSVVEDDVLVGIMSAAPQNLPAGTSWLGVPPIRLPDRRKESCSSKDRFSYRPNVLIFLGRLVFDFVRAQVPGLAISLFLFSFTLGPEVLMTRRAYEEVPGLEDGIKKTAKYLNVSVFWIWRIWMLPYSEQLPHNFGFWMGVWAWGVLCVLLTVLFITLVKWVSTCGRLRPGSHFLYSFRVNMVSLNLALTCITFPIFLLMQGTPLTGIYMRMLGAKVGRRAFVNSIYVMNEMDLMSIGDDVCINRSALLGTHTFEDRIMKIDRIVLEDSTAVGCESAVLRGSALRERAVLEDSTLCMVDEELLRGRHRGCPSSRCA